MNAHPFDPYAAESRQLWRNRVVAWRANASESAFSGLAWCAAFALFAWAAIGQSPLLRATLVWLHAQYPWTSLCGFAALLAIDHLQMRRAQRQRWASDWLCAQPIAPAMRRRRRLRALALRFTWQCALLAALLSLANANAMAWLVASVSGLVAAFVGNLLGDSDRSLSARPRRRETLFTSTAVGSVSRWQWIEAGASLAPRHLAPLLLVILLVPRGPAVMAVAALILVMMASGISAWLRSVHVMIAAERWLAVEPISARVWLAQCVRMPLASLFISALIVAGALTPAANAWLALIVGTGLLMLGTLYVTVVASGRAHPRRISLRMTLHVGLLIAATQAFALLVPVVFAVQLFMLVRRSLR